jgi:uncharacterized protein DUF1876
VCKNMCNPEGRQYGPVSDLDYRGNSINLSVRTLVDRNASVAEVTYVVSNSEGGTVYRQTGSSKREPGDPFFADLGEQLAVSRALTKLANELELTVYESFPWSEEPLMTIDDVIHQAGLVEFRAQAADAVLARTTDIPEEFSLSWMLRWIKAFCAVGRS